MVQSVDEVSEPTCRELSAWVGLCILFRNLPPWDCRQGEQVDCTCSKPTSREQSAVVHPVVQFPNLPPWDCRLGAIDCL